jgi:hypothetical protein
MADTYAANFNLSGQASVDSDLDNRRAYQSVEIGQDEFPSLAVTYASGSATGQIQKYYARRFTIAGGANQDIDLAGSVTSDLVSSGTVTFATVKELIVAIVEPDGTKVIRVGPQNVSNGWQGPFGGVGANDYEQVYHHFRRSNPFSGWTVTAGSADILRIHNPGGSAVDVDVIILGT